MLERKLHSSITVSWSYTYAFPNSLYHTHYCSTSVDAVIPPSPLIPRTGSKEVLSAEVINLTCTAMKVRMVWFPVLNLVMAIVHISCIIIMLIIIIIILC